MRVAAVDIGTNTVRLLIADCADPSRPDAVEWVDRRNAITRLGAGVDQSGRLAAGAMGRTVAVLAGYGSAVQAAGVDAAVAVATSATRDAANRDVFLDRAEAALGFRPSVIGGDEEAALAFRGTTHRADGGEPHLVIDPGGGSTEFVLGKTDPDQTVSVDIGSVRLTERRLPDRPATVGQLAAARSEVRRLFDSVMLSDVPGTVHGVGGTFTTLAALATEGERIDGVELSSALLGTLVERLARLTVDETAALEGVDPLRAEVLLGGAVVVETALDHIGATTVRVSERDLLDGIVLRAASRAPSH